MTRRKNTRTKNAAWDHERGELRIYIDNDYQLYQQKEAIEKNLARKAKKGVYGSKKAPKLWMYLVDAGARKYCKEFGCSMRNTIPKKNVREPIAKDYAKEWEAENLALLQNPGRRSNPRMTKADATVEFEEIYIPAIEAKEDEYGGGLDKIMRREEWNNYVDFLARDGMITEKQADTWVMPKKFERRRKNPYHTRPDKPKRKKKKKKAAPYSRARKGGGRRSNPKTSGVSMRSIMSKALK